jgi:hypothetical protein
MTRAKLRHGHAAERRGDKGAQFDDAQIRQERLSPRLRLPSPPY